MTIAAMTANVTSAIFDVRFVDENLGGYGSELRSDMLLGYLTRLGTEYYKPIGSTPFFVQPHVQYLREPVYLWANQKRVSERLFQRAGGGLDLGITANKNLQAALVYQASTIRWVLKDGTDDSPTPHASGTTQSVAGHLVFTNRTAEIASPTGSKVDLAAGYLLHTIDSNEAPFMNLKARQSFRLATNDLVIVSANVDTYFRRNVADPLRFTLGGLYAFRPPQSTNSEGPTLSSPKQSLCTGSPTYLQGLVREFTSLWDMRPAAYGHRSNGPSSVRTGSWAFC